jgi:bifunctional oligoribonuclease and PAP phosphatase NrnA
MTSASLDLLAVPAARRDAIHRIAAELAPGSSVALSTHVNADGDGCGSETAFARLLGQRGVTVRIVNPTPWPAMFGFLLGDDVRDRSEDGAAALRGIDTLVVMDISDVSRLGALAEAVRALRVPKLVIDHHIASDEPAGNVVFADQSACATGELVYDFARELGLQMDERIAVSLYTALLTDTGGFRFSNTSPRCHAIAGQLLAAGVDPEEMYRRVYASVPVGRLRMLRDALGTLEVDPELGLAWLSVPAEAMEQYGLRSEDLDGVVEHARSIEGTRLALFFRDLGYGKVKVSFRSTGEVDVNRFARNFGGGGHARAAGALIPGKLDEVRQRVLDEARTYLAAGAPA